jgi:hypothetical protein
MLVRLADSGLTHCAFFDILAISASAALSLELRRPTHELNKCLIDGMA